MDARLFRIPHRPRNLLQRDLPLLARAIVDNHIGRASVKTGVAKNLGYVYLVGPGYSIQVMSSDWKLILPLVANPSLVYVSQSEYHDKLLEKLMRIFPERYPTSEL